MSKWWIFKCQNCGKKFKEKFSNEDELTVDIERIGIKTHIVSTHNCKGRTYGCGTLIGAEIRGKGDGENE